MTGRTPEATAAACRLPRLDGAPGPAVVLSPDQAEAAIASALVAAGVVPGDGAGLAKGLRRPRFLAGTLLLAATLAALAYAGLGRFGRDRPTVSAAPPWPSSAASPAAPPLGASHASDWVEGDADTGQPEVVTPLPPRAAPPIERPPSVVHAHGTGVALASADLLRVANALRAERRWREGAQAYEKVVALQPGSDDAYAALVAAGTLRVQHLDDPQGALLLFAAADRLRPGGALAEEVAWSRALAYRALGEREGEARALAAFVAAYPASPWRARAQKRLADLTP